jgi:hypothetical protein
MVWRRMGLLEDAIREHLELKRLRGADPAQVARERHDALDPPTGEQPAAPLGDQVDENGTEPTAVALAGEELAGAEGASVAPMAEESGTNVGQETAELDMQAVLENPDVASEHAGEEREEDPLEWEVPASASRQAEPDDRDGVDRRSGSEHEEESPMPGREEAGSGRSQPDRDDPQQGRLSL